jgi:hypothetical protein
MVGQPQQFDQTNFGEGLFGGNPSPPSPNPPQTSFSVPSIICTPVDHIPFCFEIPSAQSITISFDFTRLLYPGESLQSFNFATSPGLAVSNIYPSPASGAIASAFITNSTINGKLSYITCSFIGSIGTQNARVATLVSYDSGERVSL